MLSILSSEYGHIMAILCACLAIWALRKKRNVKLFLLNILSILAFAKPMYQALELEQGFRDQFQKSFHISNLGTPLVNPVQAYLGAAYSAINLGIASVRDPNARFERFIYSKESDRDLNLDLYRNTQKPKASPWLLVIHGGSWEGGDSEQLPNLNSYLAHHGYSIIAITYRFSPHHVWPAQKEDLQKAMNFIKAHSDEFGIDINNFFVLGRSAGAQLAGVLAYDHPEKGLRGYIGLYPPTDLTFGYDAGDEDDVLQSRALLRRFMGGTPYDLIAHYKDASVIEAMIQNPNPVPTLLFHGELDRLTWFKHSERLVFRLEARKSPAVFIKLPWATHGFDYNINGPGGQISTHLIESFMNRYRAP